jgi:uncharacterized phiE125 gp8 family phage protein
MALNANALVDLATAKTYLKIPIGETSQDALVEIYINAASEEIERECDRSFKSQSHTETRHGRKQNILLLKQWPVTAIASLRIDNDSTFTAPSTLIDSSDYRIGDDGNSLVLLNQVFPNGYSNIQVVYTAGYATVPADLQHACLWMVSWFRQMRDSGDIGRESKSKGDETVTMLQTAPQYVKDAINRYKKSEFGLLEASMWNS